MSIKVSIWTRLSWGWAEFFLTLSSYPYFTVFYFNIFIKQKIVETCDLYCLSSIKIIVDLKYAIYQTIIIKTFYLKAYLNMLSNYRFALHCENNQYNMHFKQSQYKYSYIFFYSFDLFLLFYISVPFKTTTFSGSISNRSRYWNCKQ